VPPLRTSALAVALLVGSVALVPVPAAAREPGARADESVARANLDTTYGRVDGDLGVSIGAGATFGPSAPRAAADVRFRYLDTAGLFGFYEDGLSATSSDPRRLFGLGFEVRPLFLGRWLVGSEIGVSWLDLFIDSLGLELGTFFEEPIDGALESRPGVQVSLGLEVPLMGRASGLFIGLHGGGRFTHAALEGENSDSPEGRSGFLTITLEYHQIFAAHLVDARDTAPR
jgi:hypothetical protein